MDSTPPPFAVLFPLLLLTLPNFLALPNSATRIASTMKPRRLHAKLFHYNSIFSPTYNPSDTVVDHATYMVQNSAARLAYLRSKVRTSLASSNDVQAHLDIDRGIFLVKFSLGQPPVPQLAVMDTGSTLLWVECKRCMGTKDCFDPSKSSSYAATSCEDAKCDSLPRKSCDTDSNQCKFSIAYENHFSTGGVLSTDQFTFETFDEGSVVVPNVSFGCSTTGGLSGRKFNGIFGLGDSPTSLVTKLGNKFSYCIGNMNDPEYSYNRLVIGDGADIEGYSTPFEMYKGLYYVTLEGASLGDIRLHFDPNVFKRTLHGSGGMIIDSGAELSYIPETEYSELYSNIRLLLDPFLQRVIYKTERWSLCYNGSVSRDLVGFPAVTFHLAEGADLVLDTGSLFYYKEPQVFCLAIHPVRSFEDIPEPDILSIIGIRAQQNYNVAYDLTNQTLYLQRMDCQLLDD
ncbi:PREDICTED: aspartic proteinase CDR1 [Theobroma cacao]|uniref:Aspartic proteinase CDR1 n=1 Tax=Theobroma cacao TaxID=3641 RepID=A0AB32WRE2_THECC|nr:PREDICTED: aspartic proteinase CDR1 [Theobroma cacao]